MKKMNLKDIIILGLMNFALFVGAGNIILPPFIGLQAGTSVWHAAIGFLLTGVGLPIITAIAMARVGGSLPEIVKPIGTFFGTIIIIICYLCVGPLGATPRTATVAYSLGVKPFYDYNWLLLLYSFIFFIFVTCVSLYPQKLFETVGKFLSPIKILALIILAVTVFILPASAPGTPLITEPFAYGIKNGYLTMDTLAALVFGIVIVGSIRSRNVYEPSLITRYAIYSGLIAGLALIIIYLSLFRLGTASTQIATNAQDGADVLAIYVHYSYGTLGNIFLGLLITIACLVTAIGLTCAGATYFNSLTGINYRILVLIITGISMLVSNLGLAQLLKVSIPAMNAIYPVFIVLIFLSFINKKLHSPTLVATPLVIVALMFGLVDAATQIASEAILPSFYKNLPLFNQGLAWLVPIICLSIICIIVDILLGKKNKA